MSASDATKLVNDEGLPERFFVSQIVRRRLVSHIVTSTGQSWFMRDWHFSAVTLQRDQDNTLLGIIISSDDTKYTKVEKIIERLLKSTQLASHPLLPIIVAADGAVEDYRVLSDELLVNSEDVHHSLGLPFKHTGSRRLKHSSKDPARSLVDLSIERERLIRLSGDIKAFNASIQSLRTHNHRAANPIKHGVLSGAVLAEIDQDVKSMLDYLSAASHDISERVVATDTRLQMLFAVVRTSV